MTVSVDAAPPSPSPSAPPAATPTAAATATPESTGRNNYRKASRTASSPTATSTSPAEQAEYYEEDEEEHPRRNSTAATRRVFVARRRHRRRCERRIQLEVELLREPLGGSQCHQLEPRAVVPLHESRRRFAADIASVRIRDESFGPAARRDEAMSASVLARFLGNEKDHRPRVACGIAGIPYLADLPLASDLERGHLDVESTDVRKRDDRDLAPGFRANILSDSLHSLDGVGLEYVREIVYQPGRGRYLDALWKEEEPGGPQNGEQRRRRWKPDQNRSKYLLSLDFMVWQEVYLADDSHKT